MLPLLACLLALGADRLFGEPRRHPLAAFGRLADWLEARLNNRRSKLRGAAALLLAGEQLFVSGQKLPGAGRCPLD